MCCAVAACNEHGIFHRDIKPEVFMIEDHVIDSGMYASDGRKDSIRRLRRINVKLMGFGLSTTDVYSRDLDCGSQPYVSYGENSIANRRASMRFFSDLTNMTSRMQQ